MEKTNVMRLLDQKKIPYTPYHIETDTALSAPDLAEKLHLDPAFVYKTLVTVGKSGRNYVYMLPSEKELDLKKAANAAHEKSIEMVKSRDLLELCGYVHGGCSPIGMKKPFETFLDASAEAKERIIFSAGRIGYQVEISPQDLAKMIRLKITDLAKDS